MLIGKDGILVYDHMLHQSNILVEKLLSPKKNNLFRLNGYVGLNIFLYKL